MLFACFLLAVESVPAGVMTEKDEACFRDIFLTCRDREGPTTWDDLRAYAQANGFSDTEMAARLAEFAKTGLEKQADATRRHVAASAIYALTPFAGENGIPFIREVIRDAEDGNLRQAAVLTGIGLTPEKCEEWVREVEMDKRFGDFDRWLVYESAFKIGRDGDGTTRQRVIEVLTEMRGKDSYRVNQNRLGGWIAELKGGDAWEAWLKEVVTGKGFYPANRKHAFNLAMQAGRNGDAETRQRVIDVFTEMCNDESLDVDRNALRQWIGELEKLP